MKIGSLEIVQGPNIGWLLFTAILLVPAISYGNWWPIGAWIVFNVAVAAVCIPLHLVIERRKKRPDRPMTDEELDRWYERNIKDGR